MTISSPTTELNGTITSISLPSLLQMLSWEKSNSTVIISAPGGEGNLYFMDGEVIDAETINYRGIEAVYRICSWQNPIMRISSPVSRPRNIHVSVDHILLESSQRLDEQAEQLPSTDTVDAQPEQIDIPPAFPTAMDTTFQYQNNEHSEELEILRNLDHVTQCAITDKQGNILAQSTQNLKFESILRYGILTGNKMQSVLECNKQEYIAITASTPGTLYLIPDKNRTICIHFKKETSPDHAIEQVRSALLQIQNQESSWNA